MGEDTENSPIVEVEGFNIDELDDFTAFTLPDRLYFPKASLIDNDNVRIYLRTAITAALFAQRLGIPNSPEIKVQADEMSRNPGFQFRLTQLVSEFLDLSDQGLVEATQIDGGMPEETLLVEIMPSPHREQ